MFTIVANKDYLCFEADGYFILNVSAYWLSDNNPLVIKKLADIIVREANEVDKILYPTFHI